VYLAACAIGRGRAWLVADADLLHDEMWAAPTPRGAERTPGSPTTRSSSPSGSTGWLE
jgi:hypothetical protein